MFDSRSKHFEHCIGFINTSSNTGWRFWTQSELSYHPNPITKTQNGLTYLTWKMLIVLTRRKLILGQSIQSFVLTLIWLPQIDGGIDPPKLIEILVSWSGRPRDWDIKNLSVDNVKLGVTFTHAIQTSLSIIFHVAFTRINHHLCLFVVPFFRKWTKKVTKSAIQTGNQTRTTLLTHS